MTVDTVYRTPSGLLIEANLRRLPTHTAHRLNDTAAAIFAVQVKTYHHETTLHIRAGAPTMAHMCGRYANTIRRQEIEEQLALAFHGGSVSLRVHESAPQPNPHVRPTTQVLLARCSDDEVHLAGARWGLVPSWSKSIATRPLINARSETIMDKPSFRSAIRKRRVVLPASHYFEWQRRADGSKQVHELFPSDGQPAWMAGILEWWRDAQSMRDGELIPSVAVITTAATPDIAHIHDRQPLMVPRDQLAQWLDPAVTEIGETRDLLMSLSDVPLHAEPTELPPG